MKFFNLTEGDWIPCSVCNQESVDLHHIEPRSKFGSKRKDEQDKVENLVALCRSCHDKAHANILTKDYLKELQQKLIDEN